MDVCGVEHACSRYTCAVMCVEMCGEVCGYGVDVVWNSVDVCVGMVWRWCGDVVPVF